MRDYAVNFDVGYVRHDEPRSDAQSATSVPFVVQTDGKNKYVNIGIVSGAHGSHVAGIAAGNRLFGGTDERCRSGREDRVVAGVPVRRRLHGARAVRGHDLRRQAEERRRDQHVDRRPAGAQRRQQRALRALRPPDRAVERADVHLDRATAAPASTPPATRVSAAKVLGHRRVHHVRHVPRRTTARRCRSRDNLHYFSLARSARGRRLQARRSSRPARRSRRPRCGSTGRRPRPYALPPGYALLNGTSMAAPQARRRRRRCSISAAKQAGVQHQPAQIRQALISSARLLDTNPLPGVRAGQWPDQCRRGLGYSPARITSRRPTLPSSVEVNTTLEDFLATPGSGGGSVRPPGRRKRTR